MVNQAPHQLDLFCWFMGPIDEVYGHWTNLNHPYLEVDDTALAIVKFKSGAIGNIIVSNQESTEKSRCMVKMVHPLEFRPKVGPCLLLVCHPSPNLR